MFPQLVAGPIVRYDTIAREINDRKISADDIAEGLFRFLIGLGKKVILANQFSEIADQFLAGNLSNLSTAGAWIGLFAYALQIYFDFSGYSDMAIGMGRCMGFHFNENIDHPYISRSVTEFWRRWHISLGIFFRDYLYIPLGGNRKRQTLNILTVWMLTGLWHGASWNFVLWGLYFGVLLLIEKYVVMRFIDKLPRILTHIYALALIILSWGLFYFDKLTSIGTFYTALFGQGGAVADIAVENAIFNNFWLWVVAIVFCMPTRRFVTNLTERLLAKNQGLLTFANISTRTIVSLIILILSVALLVGATNNAFIYTRF
jgi:alginate O-acetyltransferase complex protein AlgI